MHLQDIFKKAQEAANENGLNFQHPFMHKFFILLPLCGPFCSERKLYVI